jgi:hypothetical protein
MRFQSLPALAALVPLVAADWLIKSPAAGVQLTAGVPIVVTIDDSGAAPPISTFSTFTLELIQGGQDEGTGQVSFRTEGGNAFSAGWRDVEMGSNNRAGMRDSTTERQSRCDTHSS